MTLILVIELKRIFFLIIIITVLLFFIPLKNSPIFLVKNEEITSLQKNFIIHRIEKILEDLTP